MSNARLAYGESPRHFYTAAFPGVHGVEAPTFQWLTASPDSELLKFSQDKLDDDGVIYTLPFSFPFFGSSYTSVFISSNGALIFDPTYTPAAGDAYSDLPSEDSPNGMIAPFWDDLICTSSTHVYAELLEDGATFVVQWSGMHWWTDGLPDSASTETASFEVRLHMDGRIEVNILEFGVDRYTGSTKVGIETLDGTDGFNVANALPSTGPFAISITPWLLPLSPTSGYIAANSAADFTFTVSGNDDRDGYMTIQATDSCGGWTSQREVRIKQKAFTFSWMFDSWGTCTTASCDPGVTIGLQHRQVDCVGRDNVVYSAEVCSSLSPCSNFPLNWQDSFGYNCMDYVYNAWCTSGGLLGAGWKASWGTFNDTATNGITASGACCACGGGGSQLPPSTARACSSPTSSCLAQATETSGTTITTESSTTAQTTTPGQTGKCIAIMKTRAATIKAALC
jgi:hypothetical protein